MAQAKAKVAAAAAQGPGQDYRMDSAVYAYCNQIKKDLRSKRKLYFPAANWTAGGAAFAGLVGTAASIVVAVHSPLQTSQITKTKDVNNDGFSVVRVDKSEVNTALITAIAVGTAGIVAVTGLVASALYSETGQAHEALGDLEIRWAEAQRKSPSTSDQAHYVELLAVCRTVEGNWLKSRKGVTETLIKAQLK